MRDANLIPLTHDHHHALAACRRLRLTADESEAARKHGARAFLEFFATDGLAHFREEEELLFPLIVDEDDAQATLSRVMIEHLRLHAAVKDLRGQTERSTPASESMVRVATLLEDHIRFEEKVVFPLIEVMVDEDELGRVALSPRDRSDLRHVPSLVRSDEA